MKKTFIIASLLMAFAMMSHGQARIDMGQMGTTPHPKTSRNSIAPEKAIYQRQDGGVILTFRDTFVYDEYEYFLAEVVTELQDLGEWIPYTRRTYECDFNQMPITILTERWDGGWVNQERVIIDYVSSFFPPRIHTETLQNWEDNEWVNVTQRIYDYDQVMTILVKDWINDHYGNHYLYTYTREGDEETILLQFWKDGAWQNQEQDMITYNENDEVKEIVHTVWDLPNWINETHYQYEYDGPYQLNHIVITEWENGGWSSTKSKTIIYRYDEMGNSLQAVCESNYYGGEELNTDIEVFYNEGESMIFENITEVSVDYVDVTKLQEYPAASQFIVAPNPAHSHVNVLGEGFERAEVYSLTGQRVLECRSADIELQDVAPGAYLLRLQGTDGRTETRKLLVQ